MPMAYFHFALRPRLSGSVVSVWAHDLVVVSSIPG